MPTYRVIWEIDVEADTPREAAKEARRIQLDRDSWATVFIVGKNLKSLLEKIPYGGEEIDVENSKGQTMKLKLSTEHSASSYGIPVL